MLNTCDVAAILEAGLNPAVKNMCQDGKFDLKKCGSFLLPEGVVQVICTRFS